MPTLLTPPVEDATRRDFLAGLAAAGLLVGCGSPQPTAQAPQTRTIETLLGAIDVPVLPQRVAMLDGYAGLDTAVLVGASIVGLSRNPMHPDTGVPGYVDPAGVADLPDLGWADGINAEQVAAVAPDLIIGGAFLEEDPVTERLRQVAPLALFADVGYRWTEPTDWQITVRKLADALGRPDAAEAGIAGIDARIESLRTSLADRAGRLTVSTVRIRSEFVQLYPGLGPGSAVLHQLGVARPPGQGVDDDQNAEFSQENIGDLDGDVILVFGLDEDAESGPYFDGEFSRNPLWQRLRAVQAGQVHVVASGPWNHSGSVQALNAILTDLERILPGADPTVLP